MLFEYNIFANGTIKVEASLNTVAKRKVAANIPRFGLTLEMPKEFRNIEYYGMGPDENLSDMYAQSIIGIYNTTVKEMDEPYIRPQDSGNRTKVRYLKVTDNEGNGLKFAVGQSVTFNGQVYKIVDAWSMPALEISQAT